MIMIFKGIQYESLIEWPGKICTVVFVAGCNFRCPYCHNRDLVLAPEKLPDVGEREILKYLRENRNLLDGLMITGGEPLRGRTFKDLIEFIKKVKNIGLKVGIETNGSFPEAILALLGCDPQKNLRKGRIPTIDYIAMDIKTALREKKYEKAAGVKVCPGKIKKSIDIIMNSGLDYEFKTTAIPGIVSEEDILEIARGLKGVKKYVLQQFQPKNTLDKKFEKVKPYPKEWFEKVAENLKKYLTNVELRIY